MKRMRFVVIICALLILSITGQSAWATMDFEISCEGTRSNGGGTYEYQYTLRNITAVDVTLTEFFVGTEDPIVGNYTFIPTPGFNVSIILNDAYPPCDVTYTTLVKTPHGVVPPQSGGVPSARVIYWAGSALVPPGGTVTFAFNHPHAPWDEEWFANSSNGWTISQINQPIAGPIGIFTLGYVHAPGPYPDDRCCELEKEKNDGWIPPANGTSCLAFVVAQSFISQEDYELCKVRVVLASAGGSNATLYVQDDPSNAPGTIYTQASISGISSSAWYEFDVPDVMLLAGNEYYIRVSGNVVWRHDDTNPYPSGIAYQDMTPLTFRDHFFITYSYAAGTKVELASVTADGYDGYVEVKWMTETEIDNSGFHLHRSWDPDNPSARINNELIPTRGDELQGASYTFVDRDVANGLTYHYWIESIDLDGKGTMYGPLSATAGANDAQVPARFGLKQNYPNPFNPVTEIKYDLPEDCYVKLEIYNVLGQRVATLVDENQKAGSKVVRWNVHSEVSSGTYFCRLQAGSFVQTKKMVFLK